MSAVEMGDGEFTQFRRFIYESAGITLSPAKKAMVQGRLAKRVVHCNVGSYAGYFRLLASGRFPAEVQLAIDLLTTNETYFFREPKHFEVLAEVAAEAARARRSMRVWSAACSSGEEAYTIAMVLAEHLGSGTFEVVGSDISQRVLASARRGHYHMSRATKIPMPLLRRFCLKGKGKEAGTLLVDRALRARVRFLQMNLNVPLAGELGTFDVIFLRNVMIYFSEATKKQVLARVIGQLNAGGLLFVGHSESLHGLTDAVVSEGPAVYRKR